jgi:hypothetical protein
MKGLQFPLIIDCVMKDRQRSVPSVRIAGIVLMLVRLLAVKFTCKRLDLLVGQPHGTRRKLLSDEAIVFLKAGCGLPKPLLGCLRVRCAQGEPCRDAESDLNLNEVEADGDRSALRRLDDCCGNPLVDVEHP